MKTTEQAWTNLDDDDIRGLLISLIGHRFGDRPEERIDEIRAERAGYARKFIRLASIRPTDRVLELGSGCGFGTGTLAESAREVVACDISPAYLGFARRECVDLENVRFQEIASRDLAPIDDQSVDAVVSMAVFIHLNLYDIHHYFRAFARILKPGGRVVIDFADMNRLFSRIPNHALDEQFLSHAGFYRDEPGTIATLMQWNSARGIRGVARKAGFRFAGRFGQKLVFRKK